MADDSSAGVLEGLSSGYTGSARLSSKPTLNPISWVNPPPSNGYHKGLL